MLKYSDQRKKTCTDIYLVERWYMLIKGIYYLDVCVCVVNCQVRDLFIRQKPRKAFHSEFRLKLPCFQTSVAL